MSLNFGSNFSRSERYTCQIVAGAHAQLIAWGIHQLQYPLDGIVHVQHGQTGVIAQKTTEGFSQYGFVVNVNGVIGRTSSGQRLITNDAWKTHRTHVDSVFEVVVLTPVFARSLTDAVYGSGLSNGFLGRVLFGCIRAKCSNRTGEKHLEFVLFGNIQDVE